MIATASLALRFGNARKVHAVKSLAEASDIWCRLRDARNLGASESPLVTVINADSGETVARISYNGRIWAPDGKEICVS